MPYINAKQWRPMLTAVIFSAAPYASAQTPLGSPLPPGVIAPQPASAYEAAAGDFQKIYDFLQRSAYTPGGGAEATRMIDEMQSRFPQNPYTYLALAELKFLQSGGSGSANISEEATALARKALAMSPSIPDSYILLAKIAVQQRSGAEAMSMATTAVKLAPNKPEAQFALGRAAQLERRFKEAQAAFLASTDAHTDPVRKANNYYWLGQAYVDDNQMREDIIGNIPKAREAFQSAAKLNPTAITLNNYGWFLVHFPGDYREAEPVLKRSLELAPGMGNALSNYGYTQYLKWADAYLGGKTRQKASKVVGEVTVTPELVFTEGARYIGMEKITYALLRSGEIGNIDVQGMEKDCDCTALSNAAYSGNLKLLKDLLGRGANVNLAGTAVRRTALIYSAMNGDVPMTQYLLAKGARPNVSDATGGTPLSYAIGAGQNNLELVRALISHKADLSITVRNGMPLSAFALHANKPDVLRLLLVEHKQNPNVLTNGMPLLYLAGLMASEENVKVLLEAGADPFAKRAGSNMTVVDQLIPQMAMDKERADRIRRIREMVIEAQNQARPK